MRPPQHPRSISGFGGIWALAKHARLERLSRHSAVARTPPPHPAIFPRLQQCAGHSRLREPHTPLSALAAPLPRLTKIILARHASVLLQGGG